MSKDAKPLIELNDGQREIINREWHMDTLLLTQKVFGDLGQQLTRRNVEYKSVMAYLATIGKTPGEPDVVGLLESLTSGQKEFIKASYKEANGPVEMARLLFKKDNLLSGSREVRMVLAYIKSIDATYRRNDELADEIEYQFPKSVTGLIDRLNRYRIINRPDGNSTIEKNKLTPQQARQLDALLGYLQMPVLTVEASKFSRKIDREVFESIFLSTCWDKPDLSSEHLLQYLQIASLNAQANEADRTRRKLDERFEASLEDPNQRLSKTEVEALDAMRAKSEGAVKQINALIKSLTVERSRQVNDRMAGASSMHPLVAAWKNVEDRRKILALVDKTRRQPLRAEVERLSTMDSLKAELWGLSKDDILK